MLICQVCSMVLNLCDESTLLIQTGQNQVATTMLSNESNVNTFFFFFKDSSFLYYFFYFSSCVL